MNKAPALLGISVCLLWPAGSNGAPAEGASPPVVVAQLIAHAASKPVGPVEDDVTEQTVQTTRAIVNAPGYKVAEVGSDREIIAAPYSTYTLAGLLTPLYQGSETALFEGKVTLTADGKSGIQEEFGPPGFAPSGGFSIWVGPPVREDGQVIATFCLLRQHGRWKVHGVYLSNDVLENGDKNIIVQEVTAFLNPPPRPRKSIPDAWQPAYGFQ